MNGAHRHACLSRLPHPHRYIYYPSDNDCAESYSLLLVEYMYQEDKHLHCRDHRSWLGTASTDLFGRLQLDRFCLASRSVLGSNTHDPYAIAVVSLLVVYAHAQTGTCLTATSLNSRRKHSRMFPNPRNSRKFSPSKVSHYTVGKGWRRVRIWNLHK